MVATNFKEQISMQLRANKTAQFFISSEYNQVELGDDVSLDHR